jgi:phospholipid/cholesterol/gamma-HCH transport system substrate-binding protein
MGAFLHPTKQASWGPRMRRLELGLAFLAVVAAGIVLSRVLPQAAPYEVKVPVEDAAGLSPGSDLMIAGAKAGSVQSIVMAHGSAWVTVALDPEHAPLRRDARISVRPKSLLGERYLALDPGQAGETLASGASLPSTSVTSSTSLEDVINTFDQPTREKLQTLIVELGSGVAGRGQELNQGLEAGHEDLASLRGIASTLASRDGELKKVIVNLDGVTQELARSDRRQQLGALIQNLEALLRNLADQETQLQQALSETNAALARTANGLDGTAGNLAGIARQLPATVHLADLIMADLGPDSDILLPRMGQLNTAIGEGPSVFGGMDANGYATRISLILGCSTAGVCPTLPSSSAVDFLLGKAGGQSKP